MITAAAALLLVPAVAAAQTASAPAPAPAAAPAAEASGNVYGTALAPGWQSWPWDKTVTELSVDIGSARRPIKVQPGGWGALYLHHDGFDTTPYRGIGFLIQSVEAPMKVQVMALVGGKPIEGKTRIVEIAPGGWKKVVVPLGDLGAANAKIDGLWFQNGSGEPGPAFFVTEIAFQQ